MAPKLITWVVLVSVVFTTLTGLARAADERGADVSPVDVSVDRAKSTLRLEVRGAPLRAVLDAVARSTATTFSHGALPSEPLFVVCEQASLPDMMECLLGADAHLAVRYARGSAGVTAFPEEIWILHPGVGRNSNRQERALGAGRLREQASARNLLAGREADGETLSRGSALASASDPSRRAQGVQQLAGLGQRDDPDVRAVLQRALADPDSGVRSQAVVGLGRHGDAESAAILMQALRDEDVDVRLIAVETAGSDAGGVAVLREAMRDQDRDVSSLAATKLQSFDGSEGSD